MTRPIHPMVTASHLQRDAYLYVRQATVQQSSDNTGSAQHQYTLRERAVALGWPVERIHVIDSDLGRSGASSADREGFQKLAYEIGMGRAGIVLATDASRLTRSSSGWHRLLEICALADTLLLVEERIYDPGDLGDLLILGDRRATPGAELREVLA